MQNPEQLLEQLCQNADVRKARSLRLIFAICKEQKERGSKDYSVATIAKISSQRGGPGEGAIRNPTGEVYRALIQAYADSVGGQKKKHLLNGAEPCDAILEGVTDPVLRTRINLLLSELQSLRGQLNAARHLANQKASIQFGPKAPVGQALVPSSSCLPSFTELEIRTLRKAVCKETFEHWGWQEDQAGRVSSHTGQPIFGPWFTTAIKKVLEHAEVASKIIEVSQK